MISDYASHVINQMLTQFKWEIRHEIVGVVTEVGSRVLKYEVGDKVGVECLVGSCQSCDKCANNLENYCPGLILTYGAKYHDGIPPRMEVTPTSWWPMSTS